MLRFIAVIAMLAGFVASAQAADLALPMKEPATPAYNWSGWYVGINGGGGWGDSHWQGIGRVGVSGGLAGGTAGYNWQFGQVVLGLEGDVDWAGLSGTNALATCPGGSCGTSDTWLSTVRGRLGYAADRFMPYVTGGAAFSDIRATTPGFIGATNDKAGWTVGAGLEFAIAGNWTAKAEYLYVDLGKFNCGLSCGPFVSDNASFTTSLVRAGVNYRF